MGRIEISKCVQYPAGAVEVTSEQTAGVPMKQRIDPNVNLAGEMALQDLIVVRQVLAVGCLRVGNATTNGRAPS